MWPSNAFSTIARGGDEWRVSETYGGQGRGRVAFSMMLVQMRLQASGGRGRKRAGRSWSQTCAWQRKEMGKMGNRVGLLPD